MTMRVMRRYLSLLVFATFFLQSFLVASHAGSSANGLDGRFPSLHASRSIDLAKDESIDQSSSNSNITSSAGSVTEDSSDVQNNSIPLWKRQLPFPLCNKTNTLRRVVIPAEDNRQNYYPRSKCEVEVYLLGTAHVSRDSSRDVRLLLESVKPDAIFLEICHQRLNLLESSDDCKEDKIEEDPLICENGSESSVPKSFTEKFLAKFRRGKKRSKQSIDTQSLSSIASSLLSNMQGDYADVLDVELGGEFIAAYEYWKSVVPRSVSSFRREDRKNHVHMILGDRPVSLTLTRAWESLGIWGKTKLLIGLIVSSLRKPKPEELREWMEKILNGDSDLMSESVADLAKHFPTLAEVILKERDIYMACKLQQTCWRILRQGDVFYNQFRRPYRLVAIVGAGHMEGIFQWLTEGGSIDAISTVARTTSGNSLNSSDANSSQSTIDTPAAILSKLIQVKSDIDKLDHDYLVGELTELNPEFIDEMEERKGKSRQ